MAKEHERLSRKRVWPTVATINPTVDPAGDPSIG